MERQRYDGEQKSGYDAPRKYGPPADPRLSDPRRSEAPCGTVAIRNCPSPAGPDPPAPRFERERLSPLQHREPAEMSPAPRFESPNSIHSDDGPLSLDAPTPHVPLPPKSVLKGPAQGGPLASLRQHRDSPGHTPPYDGHSTSLYDGPGHMGPSRQHPPGWYEGGGPEHYDESSRYDGPHPQGPARFDSGGPPQRFDVPGPHMSHGPMRGGDNMGQFDGPPHPQGPVRFDGPIGQQHPMRFEGPGPALAHFEGPMQRFNNMGPGPGSGPIGFQQQRYDGPPNQMGPIQGPGPMRFEGPMQQVSRFDMPHQGGAPVCEPAPGQQGTLMFAPQPNVQPPMRQMGPPMYENPMGPQQNFNLVPQHFPEPMNPQFPAGPMMFPAQPNTQPAPAFAQQGPTPFYNPTNPAISLQQPVSDLIIIDGPISHQLFNVNLVSCICFQVNMMGNLNQPFQPQNTVPFGHQGKLLPFMKCITACCELPFMTVGACVSAAPQVVPPDNHFGQVDVNDLLSKLISTGIIKSSNTGTTLTSGTG